jgi:phosphoribosylformylglycinamidine synthase
MANQQAEPVLEEPKPDVSTPTPAQITPAMLKLHSITAEEYARIERLMGRTPSLTELGIFSVMWSEHCSYKSSRVHLKRLPTRGTRVTGPGSVVQGPGENAGIIDVGDGWACAFKIESHNHPSYIEPHQGAATGVGGILRDIFTMNARPLAVMDSLRFGPLAPEAKSDQWSVVSGKKELTTDHLPLTTDYARNRQTMAGVVAGIAGYGNCFGVPNLGGETRFEECYSGNPLVNAFALGLVKIDEIFYAKATGVGNPVIYVGAKTGRDGIHGATMASEEFTEGSEQKRPNVQMGDPFLEKLLLEACLEAMATGAVLGIQDMGAAGLTCSTCEMGARGELGLTIELDLVPQRETGMSSYEIMLSESQERMLLVAEKGREGGVLAVFAKWGLDASIVGIVTADDTMRVTHHGELVAEIPNKALTDDAPVYKRPVGVWKAPVPMDPPAWVVEELKRPRDYTADLKRLLASANICDKRWVFEQYDSMVQTNTVQGPGGEAGVMRIKREGARREVRGTSEARPERGLAMALAGNGRWCWLDPKLGAMHAVAEAARKVACTGAVPVAATNCLNFGNPEKPEIMAQLSAAIDGIAEACKALDVPVTGGNVSLYNETKGEGIYPTPVIGVVGILEDVGKAVPADFRNVGDVVLLVENGCAGGSSALQEFGSSEYAAVVLRSLWGEPPMSHTRFIEPEAEMLKVLVQAAQEGLITAARDMSDSIAVELAEGCFAHGVGVDVELIGYYTEPPQHRLFGEHANRLLLACSPQNLERVENLFGGGIAPSGKASIPGARKIGVVTDGGIRVSAPLYACDANDECRYIRTGEAATIEAHVSELKQAWSSRLEAQLGAEVVTA